MDIIKDLDLDWFWLGYSCGSNSRKRIVESPNKIINLGKQGIKTTPTKKQVVSFFIGIKMGRGKIVQNFNLVKILQYQDKDAHKSKGNYLTLGVGKIETYRGATVTLPIYICNNTVDNRGFCGFQLKIQYSPTYLNLTSINPSSSWPHSFKYEHDAQNGVVLIQGIRDAIGYEDLILGNLSFKVKENAPSTNIITVSGPSGTGTGSDILTRINGELYFIQPITLENGKITVPAEEPETTTSKNTEDFVTILPPIGSTDDFFGSDIELSYDFDCGLNFIGNASGATSGSGANLAVKVTFGDGSSTVAYIPLQEGSNHYSGKIPIKLPSFKPGPIIIEMWVEPNDPDDFYYWFIKVGALWGFSSEIPRDQVGKLPIQIPHVVIFENMAFYDGYELIFGEEPTPEPPTPLSDLELSDIMQILEGYDIEFISNPNSSNADFILADGFIID